jgi:hypothetical protein
MTDESAAKPADAQEKPNGRPFKKGYDPRRWLKGRGKKSADQKKGEEILRAVIWDELSREFDGKNGKAMDDEETVDALRMMVRTWMRKRPGEIADRIAGKVKEEIEHTGDVTLTVKYQDK